MYSRNLMKRNNILYGILILIIGVLGYIAFSLYTDNTNLSNEVRRRDALLVSALNQDSTWIHKQDSIIQNVEKEMFFYMDDKKMSGDEFISHMNALLNRYSELEDSLQYYKNYYALVQPRLQTHFDYDESIDSVGKTMHIIYHVSYDSIVPISRKKIEDLEYNNQILSHIIDKYKFKLDKQPTHFSIRSEAIDSAMMLLPYYRDKIRYSAKDNCWIITH